MSDGEMVDRHAAFRDAGDGDVADRELDLIVWGATGYTGRLVARAVADRAPAGLRWALAGRDRARLEQLRSELVGAELVGAEVVGGEVGRGEVGRAEAGVPDVSGMPGRVASTLAEPIVADARDAASLAAMARRARAIVTTVGPYARYGTPLVAACVEAGTDLADLTGEPLWMRDMAARFHERAGERGARIVHACGFDSVPSDLGVLCVQEAAIARHGRPCREIVHAFGPMAGGVSGGTIASAFDLFELASGDPAARCALADPDLLAPGGRPSPDPSGPWWPQRHAHLEGWTAPFVMAAANGKVVRRTRHLLGEPWGPDVRYLERLRAPTWARAAAIGIGTVAGPALMAVRPLRNAAKRLLPKPGEGPSAAVRTSGYVRTTLVGQVDGDVAPVIAHVEADVDPGYGATARMVAEVGLGLAQGDFDRAGGVLTPATAGGTRLIERLGEVGIRIGVAP